MWLIDDDHRIGKLDLPWPGVQLFSAGCVCRRRQDREQPGADDRPDPVPALPSTRRDRSPADRQRLPPSIHGHARLPSLTRTCRSDLERIDDVIGILTFERHEPPEFGAPEKPTTADPR